jgi:EmrB/QacA subfamily drug resistance transporter
MNDETAYRWRWATLGVLCLSLVIIGMDNTILNVALPTLGSDLDATDSDLQWVVDGYTLVFAGLLLTAGCISDKFGRKRALASGLLVFGLASVAAAFADSAAQLIAARCVMGIGAAFIMPATLSILMHVFTDARERAKAIGLWAAVSGVGVIAGPSLGGLLLEHFWWGSVFLVNVPVAGAALLLGKFLVPESRDPSAPRVDIPGAVLSTVGLFALVWAIIEGGSTEWLSRPVLTGLAAGALLLGAFIAWERRTPTPMLDLRFFRDRRFSSAAVALALVFFAMFGALFFLTQYLQLVLGYGTLAAGQRLLPIVTMALVAPIAMRLTETVGTRVVLTSGMLIISGSLLALGTTSIDDGYGRLAIILAVLGCGMGLVLSPATHAVMTSLPPEKAGVGSAVNDSVGQVGGALGVAVLGSILSSAYSSEMPAEIGGITLPDEASSGLGVALRIAAGLEEGPAAQLVLAAQESFVNAMNVTVMAGAAFTLFGALIALVWMPGKAAQRRMAETMEAGAEHEIDPAPQLVSVSEGRGL